MTAAKHALLFSPWSESPICKHRRIAFVTPVRQSPGSSVSSSALSTASRCEDYLDSAIKDVLRLESPQTPTMLAPLFDEESPLQVVTMSDDDLSRIGEWQRPQRLSDTKTEPGTPASLRANLLSIGVSPAEVYLNVKLDSLSRSSFNESGAFSVVPEPRLWKSVAKPQPPKAGRFEDLSLCPFLEQLGVWHFNHNGFLTDVL